MQIRRATPEELRYGGESLSLRDDFKDILAKGHAIHGYSSGGGVRIIAVLESQKYSDHAPLLGYGTGKDTDTALRRARDTYRRREAEGLDYITEGQYQEDSVPLVTGGQTTSIFDQIVWGCELTMYQEGEEIIAKSTYGRYGSVQGLVGRGPDAQAAVDELVSAWQNSN